jgi:hypothetical protein
MEDSASVIIVGDDATGCPSSTDNKKRVGNATSRRLHGWLLWRRVSQQLSALRRSSASAARATPDLARWM